MKKEYHNWFSPTLSIDMPLVVYGHFGQPLLMFPTAAADCEEYERFHLIAAIQHHIEAGKVKVFCINSINRHSWMNDEIHPAERARRQVLFDQYVSQEVAPFIENHCNTPGIGIAVSGCSFGAFHSMNTLLKHPQQFRTIIAMSGSYDVKSFADGYYDDNVYFNNPVDYLPNMNDSHLLDQIRSCRIYLITSRGMWENPELTFRLARILDEKGIPHHLDVWGHEWPHDWPTWRRMLDHYVATLF